MTAPPFMQPERAAVSMLATQVSELIGLCERLREENRVLRQQRSTLLAERADLIEKNAQVRNRVEAMILRLKSMEQ
jgi:cell division protein ZapB